METVRIGIVAADSSLGAGNGVDVYTRRLVEALAGAGNNETFTVLVAEASAGAWTYRPWPAHVTFACLRWAEPSLMARGWGQFRRAVGFPSPAPWGEPYLAKQIDALKLDLVHYPRTTIFPMGVRTPCVLTVFDLQHLYYPEFFTAAQRETRSRTYGASIERARRIIVPSDHTRVTLVEKYGVPWDKVTLIPVGLAESFRRAAAAEVDRVRAKYRLPEQFLFYPANPWQHKNHARLMAALRVCRERHGELPHLVLTGRLPDERRDAMSLAIAAGVDDAVTDLGLVPEDDLPGLYSAATCMVFPSLFEGFGIPLIEAMACGCPIAAADVTAIPECVGDAALLFDPLEPKAIANAVWRLWTEPATCISLSEKGLRRVERYRWQSIVPELIEVYEKAAGQAKRSELPRYAPSESST